MVRIFAEQTREKKKPPNVPTFKQMASTWLIKLWILHCKSLRRFHINMPNILDNANDDILADFSPLQSKSHYRIDYGHKAKLIADLLNENFMNWYVCVCEYFGFAKNVHRTRCAREKFFTLACFVAGSQCEKKTTTNSNKNRRKHKLDYLCIAKKVCHRKLWKQKTHVMRLFVVMLKVLLPKKTKHNLSTVWICIGAWMIWKVVALLCLAILFR